MICNDYLAAILFANDVKGIPSVSVLIDHPIGHRSLDTPQIIILWYSPLLAVFKTDSIIVDRLRMSPFAAPRYFEMFLGGAVHSLGRYAIIIKR